MKLLILLLFSSIQLVFLLSCTGTRERQVYQRVPVEAHHLERDAFAAYMSIIDTWRSTEFHQCCSRYHLRMSCSNCEYIYIVVRIYIDSKGRVEKIEKFRANICGKKAFPRFEKCLTDYFKAFTFPKILRNRIIDTRLGNGLKC